MPQTIRTAPGRASEASRSYLVGRDAKGHWVALDPQGRAGGLYRSRHDAVRFACAEAGCLPEAVTIAAEPIAFPL